MDNIDLGKSQITDKIRVSTAAIFRDGSDIAYYPHPYWIVETWIFSDDRRQRSHQVIHGTPSGHEPPYGRTVDKAQRIHKQITENLREKHGGWRGVFYRRMWE